MTFRRGHQVPITGLAALMLAACAFGACAHEEEAWQAKVQSTYIWQNKGPFRAAYSGPNSLSPDAAQSYSWTVTAFLGMRPWAGGEVYFNPEGIQGRALSNLTGLGGLSNGELQKGASGEMRFYRARLFYRHTVGLGGELETVESDQNQLASKLPARRFVLTAGNLSVSDVFGVSEISGDVRTQFLNWASLDHGHFDYAADARSFSWGLAGELTWDDWAVRVGRFLQPKTSNGLPLDYRLFKRYGDQLEIERRHRWWGSPGQVSLLLFRNVATMGAFRDAINSAGPGTAPNFDQVRRPQAKVGFGLAVEQSLSQDLRVLARGGAHDGKTESYAFTQIDRSFYTAAALRGDRWGRARDHVGLAFATNGLSNNHRDYLARGGLGVFLGDGRLNYRSERIVEAYYSFAAARGTAISLNWQRIVNPGYNRDRGPVAIAGLRLHLEF